MILCTLGNTRASGRHSSRSIRRSGIVEKIHIYSRSGSFLIALANKFVRLTLTILPIFFPTSSIFDFSRHHLPSDISRSGVCCSVRLPFFFSPVRPCAFRYGPPCLFTRHIVFRHFFLDILAFHRSSQLSFSFRLFLAFYAPLVFILLGLPARLSPTAALATYTPKS